MGCPFASEDPSRWPTRPLGPDDTALATPAGMRLFSRGRSYEELGAEAEALRAYHRAARCEGVAADALQAIARIRRQQGALHDAVGALTRALHHCEDDPLLSFELYVELGDVYAQLGDYEEAVYYYRWAARYDDRDPALQRRLRSASVLADSRHVIIDVELPEDRSRVSGETAPPRRETAPLRLEAWRRRGAPSR